MSKLKVTEEFINKARKVFDDSETGTIRAGEGLTRVELRALENRGLVKKRKVLGRRKFADVTPPISYAWEWIGK